MVRCVIFVATVPDGTEHLSWMLVDVMSQFLRGVLPPANFASELDKLVCKTEAKPSSGA